MNRSALDDWYSNFSGGILMCMLPTIDSSGSLDSRVDWMKFHYPITPNDEQNKSLAYTSWSPSNHPGEFPSC